MDSTAGTERRGGLDTVQDKLNSAFYRSAIAPGHYPRDGLDAQETVALFKYASGLRGRRVLDLGVGPGRTARVLHRIAGSYAGIDYSPEMVDELRKVMPELDIYVQDMRDLGRWSDATIDFVFGTNNVLDAVSHADRLQTLAEVRRVLRLGGLFVFSSHNRRYAKAEAGPVLRRSRNPVTLAMNLVRYWRSLTIRASLRPLWRFEDEYALIDDGAHDRALLHYHIDRDAQERQLAGLGFELLEAFDRTGERVPAGAPATVDSCLMYVARKMTDVRSIDVEEDHDAPDDRGQDDR
jgi:SAM-dependent methyltransferase